jgi:hypothetical protein
MRTHPILRDRTALVALPALVAGAAALLAASSPAAAGTHEIDQRCALVDGCFPGDSGGFPVTITQPGTYRLTSNLDIRGVPAPQDVTAIEIVHTARGALLDLNGFALVGANTCSAPPAGCTGNGTGYGVRGTAEGIEVRDGSIVGFGQDGLSIPAYGVRVDRLRAWWNGASGINLEFDAGIVVDSAAFRNGLYGIANGGGSTTGSSSLQNGGDGFYLDGTSAATELAAWGNGDSGVGFSWNLRLTYSLANLNLGSGLYGHVFACVSSGNAQYGVRAHGFATPYTSTQQSVYAANGAGSFGPDGVSSLGQNACNGGGC